MFERDVTLDVYELVVSFLSFDNFFLILELATQLLLKHTKTRKIFAVPWCLVVITTAQPHSTKPELRSCAVSNPARGFSESRDGEARIKAKRLSSVNHTIKTIHRLHHHFHHKELSCHNVITETKNIECNLKNN